MFIFIFFYLQRENDKDHKVRLAIGNGVRAEVWREFLERFGTIKIQEFYASTEGNVGFVNYAGKIGAIGRVNFFHRVYTGFCFFVCLMRIEIKQTECVYEHLIKFNLSLKSALDPKCSKERFKIMQVATSSGPYEVKHPLNNHDILITLFYF